MNSNPTKISFIPKSSLAEQKSFMGRGRPKSIVGFLAIFVFIISVGSYVVFYFSEKSTLLNINTKIVAIKKIQEDLAKAPEINEAKLFRVRYDLAQELLNHHNVFSRVLSFVSKNSLTSAFYSDLSFKRENDNWSLVLDGEVPSYSSLAYQSDVFRKKNNDEFLDFSISNVTLTKGGTITYTLTVLFSQEELSYTKKQEGTKINTWSVSNQDETSTSTSTLTSTLTSTSTPKKPALPSFTPFSTLPPSTSQVPQVLNINIATGTIGVSEQSTATSSSSGWNVTATTAKPSAQKPVATKVATPQSGLSVFLSWFKFW